MHWRVVRVPGLQCRCLMKKGSKRTPQHVEVAEEGNVMRLGTTGSEYGTFSGIANSELEEKEWKWSWYRTGNTGGAGSGSDGGRIRGETPGGAPATFIGRPLPVGLTAVGVKAGAWRQGRIDGRAR